MGLFLQLFLVTTCFAVLHGFPSSSEEHTHSESTTAGIRPSLLTRKHDSDEDKDDVPKRVARNSPPNPKDITEKPEDSTSTTHRPYQFGSRPVREAPYPAAGPPPAPPCEKHPPPPPPEGHPPPPPPPGHPPPPPPGHPPPPPPGHPHPPPPGVESRPERDTNHPAQNVPKTRPATVPGRVDPKPVAGTPQKQNNQAKNRQSRDVTTTSTSTHTPPQVESRPERDTNHPAQNVPKTRPATLPGRIEPKPVEGTPQNNQAKNRQTRDVSTTTTSTHTPPQVESRPERDTNHPAQNVPKTRPATLPGRIEPKPVGGTPQNNQAKNRQARDVTTTSTSTHTPPQVESRPERDTNHPAQNVPKTRPATVPGRIEPKPVGGNPQNNQAKNRQSRDVHTTSTSTQNPEKRE